MIEFAPRRRRLEDVRLTDYPNTLTSASLEREVQHRIGCVSVLDPVTEYIYALQGVQRWKRRDLPGVGPRTPVTVSLGGRGYAYRTPQQCSHVVVGDVLAVPGIAGEALATVTRLHTDYDGPIKSAYRVDSPVYGVQS